MGTGALKAILAFGIVSTGLHFVHNFVRVEDYPQSETISNGAVQAAIVISWPLFTAVAILGYRAYARGELRRARGLLIAYALFTLVSLGHFIQGGLDLPPFWYATIFTDVLAGLLLLAFLAWSTRASRPAATT
jgi:hypothetical protein